MYYCGVVFHDNHGHMSTTCVFVGMSVGMLFCSCVESTIGTRATEGWPVVIKGQEERCTLGCVIGVLVNSVCGRVRVRGLKKQVDT